MANRLQHEKSLYLRQHAGNPVDWFPWGEEALETARREDKPILLSIGYSSCHWCHVMAHESFENDYIAKLMNEHFICIKVDREERPDVDQIYMDAVQMLNGHGGWPLNVFCLPDGRPFAGGTYFPPDERRGHNMVPWPQLLMRVADYFSRQRDDLEENARAIIGNLKASNAPHRATGDPLTPGDLLQATGSLLENEDPEYGGFGSSPKFPPSMTLDFLLAMRSSATVETQYPDTAQALDGCLNRTLTGMGHGGIFDQIGGGFARYSVDQQWIIPHFEKMLYDNALLIDIYSKAYQRYPKALYKSIVEETVAWLMREMRSPQGAFYAALDADTEGEEGKTYLWTPAEIKSVLGETEGTRFCLAYGITPEGNFEETGRSNPVLLEADPEARKAIASSRNRLLEARDKRPQPGRDEKLLTSWNALLVRGLAHAAWTFGRADWADTAFALGEWLCTTMRREDGSFASVAYGEQPQGSGVLEDYAASAEACLALAEIAEWHEPGSASRWIGLACGITTEAIHRFKDDDAVGFFHTEATRTDLVHRKKDWFDNAIPSGNSEMVQSLAALDTLTGEASRASLLESLKTAYPGIVQTSPAAAAHALAGFTWAAIGHAVIHFKPGRDLEALRKALVAKPWRPVYLKSADPAQGAAYQLCVGTQCLAPTDSIGELVERL